MRTKKLVGVGVSLAALALGGFIDYNIRKEHSVITNVMQSLDNVIFNNEFKIFESAIAEMERKGWQQAVLSSDGCIAQLEMQEAVNPKSVIIYNSKSRFLDQVYKDLKPEDIKFIKDNVHHIVFSPDVKNSQGSSTGDVNGLSIGKEIIFVDTQADDGGIKNPKMYSSVIMHEAQHEADKKLKLSTLRSEKRAYKKQADVLEELVKNNKDIVLEATLNDAKGRVKTAEYLEQFGADFEHVYPDKVLLAKQLLVARVSVDTLRKYCLECRSDDEKDSELFYAAKFAEIAKTKKREDAINIFYEIVKDKKCDGTIVQVSAASALAYLCPKSCAEESSADVSISGLHVNFGKRQKTGETGQGYEGILGYSVTGIPSLKELIEDKKFEYYNPAQENGSIETIIYQLDDVDSIKISNDKGQKTVLIPKFEGKPSKEFYRCYIESTSSVMNGKEDAILVYYATNLITREDGCTLAKIDKYDQNGDYISSGLTWFAAKEKGEDLPLDIKELVKELSQEK